MRSQLAVLIALGGSAFGSAAAEAAAKSRPSITYDHKGAKRTAIHHLSLRDGEGFDVVIKNTAKACFDYTVEPVPVARRESARFSLATETLALVHSKEFGGYIVAVRRSSKEEECGEGDAGQLKDSTIIVSVDVPGWELEVSGGFTASGLTNPVYGTVKDDAEKDVVVEDQGARDDASLGVASFLHVHHAGQTAWIPSLGFGLGINETSKPTYHLGAFWRLGGVAMLGAGVVLGSVDRLPVGVEIGKPLGDPNLLTKLPTRVDTQWFVAVSFSFLGSKESFQKPFAPPQKDDARTSSVAGPAPVRRAATGP